MNDIIKIHKKYVKELKMIEQDIQDFSSSVNQELIMACRTLKQKADELRIVIDALEKQTYKLGCVHCLYSKLTEKSNLYKCTFVDEFVVCGETTICSGFKSKERK